jgi:hypothetical protein
MKKYTARNSPTLKYLKERLSKGVYSKLLANANKMSILVELGDLKGTNPLSGLFIFCTTDEGHDYWWKVSEELDKKIEEEKQLKQKSY